MRKALSLILATIFLFPFSVCAQEQQEQEAVQEVAQSTTDDMDVWQLRDLVNSYKETGALDKAEETLKKIIEIAEEEWFKDWASNGLVDIYQQQGRVDEVILEYEAGLEEKAADLTHSKTLADLYTRQGRLEDALAVYEKALEASPSNRSINDKILSIYESRGRFSEAIAKLQEVIVAAPEESYLLQRLANLYREAGRKDDAKNTWEILLSAVTNDPDLYFRYGEVLYGWGDIDNALTQIEKAELMNPGNPAYALRRQAILEETGRAGKIEKAAIVAAPKRTKESKERKEPAAEAEEDKWDKYKFWRRWTR